MSTIQNTIITAVLLTLLTPALAQARQFRVAQIPNGDEFRCQTCHVEMDPTVNGARNGFGEVVEFNGLAEEGALNTKAVVWSDICDRDDDLDGYSNGEELGDTDCTWMIGMPDPDVSVSHPDDDQSIPCGNGVVESPPEECDGDNLNGETCESQSQPMGTLACDIDCSFDTTGCDGSMPSTNNATNNATNNDTGGTMQPDPPMNTNGSDPPEDDEGQDDAGAACDGELTVDEENSNSAAAVIGMLLVVAFRRTR